MKKIIAFSGQMAVGKDTAADFIMGILNAQWADKYPKKGEPWQKKSFAAAVKGIFCATFGVDIDFVEKWKRSPECPPGFDLPIRNSLQFIGDGFRTIQANIWVDILLKNLDSSIIISDGRYLNESKAVREHGGINILLYRPGYLNDDPNESERQLKKIIEWCLETKQKDGKININFDNVPEGIDNYDLFLLNDGDVNQFYLKLNKILMPLIEEKYGR